MLNQKKYGKFQPIRYRPNLPLHANDTSKNEIDVLGMFQYHYKHLAWTAYWAMVRKTAKKCKLRLWPAHQRLQKKHPFQVPDMGDEDHCWSEDDFLLLFMWQFEAWQTKTYDMDKIYDEGNVVKHNCRVLLHQRVELINAQTTVEDAFELHEDDMRDDFVSQLWCRGHKHILEQIVDDPIFGHNAKMELRSMAFSEEIERNELFRQAALPENVIVIQDRIRRVGPSIYSAFFPISAQSISQCTKLFMRDGRWWSCLSFGSFGPTYLYSVQTGRIDATVVGRKRSSFSETGAVGWGI